MATRSRPPKVETRVKSDALKRGLSAWMLLQGLLITAVTLWIYWPVRQGAWLMDDNVYFADNPLLNDPERLWKAWFAPGSFIEYYPIEQTVQWVQWQWWQNDTLGYHFSNIVLHIVSAVLVWRLLAKLGLKLAWLGGLIFAVHPVQVESVAWIVELKNTLSLPPFLLAMGAWIDFEERNRPRGYGLALGLFVVAMLCKISMAPFPAVMLLYAWWKRGRIGWADIIRAIPFAVVAVVLGAITLLAGDWFRMAHPQPNEIVPLDGFLSRMACAGLSLSFYLSQCLFPVGLSVIYPRWTVDPPSLIQFLPWPILGGILYVCRQKRGTWGRHALFGLGFFILFLLPFVGFIPASFMSSTWVMDHFLYLPIIGLIGLVIAALGRIETQISRATGLVGPALVAAVMIWMAWHSRWYAAKFIDLETLWTCTVEVNPGLWLAHNNLGFALATAGRNGEAVEQFETAVKLNPTNAMIYNNLGLALMRAGRSSEAVGEFRQALRLKPEFADARDNLSQAQAAQKNPPDRK